MSEFYSVQVTDIKKETSDTVSIAFDIPNHLKSSFNYESGQYVTLKVNVNGEELRRSYSLSSCMDVEEEHRIAVKQIENGKVSTFLNQELKTGTSIELTAPEGNFYFKKNGSPKSVVLFAAGSGITPILSILKGALADNDSSRVLLFYGNRNEESVIYNDILKEYSEKYADRFQWINVFSQPINEVEELRKGRIDQKKALSLIRQYADLSIENEYFICGPSDMMKAIENALDIARVEKDYINIEYFTPPTEPKTESQSDFSGTADVTFILDGEEVNVQVDSKTTLLDAALENDVDVPYSCRGAVCSSCIAQIDEGSVEMRMNYVLSEGEIEDRLVLTCQSCPTSSKVVVNYDEV